MTREGTGHATALTTGELRADCDVSAFDFETTSELEPRPDLIGQDRAVEAITFAAGTRHSGFNLFVYGPEGTGRHSAVRRMLESEAAGRPVPRDWIYVHNFEAPDFPRAVAVPRGTAQPLAAAMETVIDDLANDIPALFDSEEYQNRRAAIDQEHGGRNEAAFSELGEKASEKGVAILRTPMGFAVAAMKDGEVLKSEEFAKLPDEEKKDFEEKISEIRGELHEFLKSVPQREKAHRNAVAALNAQMAEQAVDAGLGEVMRRFAPIEALHDYLRDLRSDLIKNAQLFLEVGKNDDDGPFPAPDTRHHDDPRFNRYTVNVMVAHPQGADRGAPVIVEPMPTLYNLTGRVEHVSRMGALMTDFTLIKPGALHRANGGFLILDAARVISEPLAWDALKRCLETEEIRIISAAEKLSLFTTTMLEPEPIPLSVRVVLVGSRWLHMLLVALDPDFAQLFKVEADFGADMNRDPEAMRLFARMVASVTRDDDLRPATADGVGALVEASIRDAGDREKLSLRLDALWDVLREADHIAARRDGETITRADVEAARDAAERRADRPRERVQEMIARGTVMIDVSGEARGQVNGLTVATLGSFMFGAPVRITARVRMGAGQVIDIEREVKLGGPIHTKGVMILSGFLATHYAPETPLSLWASLVFEQSYAGVEGDSASVAELCALLSALSGLPIAQSLAVTGSVNQMGEVQPVGGVNHKIEGFFDACKAQGLTGQQGVLLPRSNVDNLMLRKDVVAAVEAGEFHVHAIETVDQAIALLTGVEAGARGSDGRFPEGTVNARVEDRLREFAALRKDFGAGMVTSAGSGGRPSSGGDAQ